MHAGTKALFIGEWMRRLLLLAVGLIFIFPLYWVAITSLKTIPETAAFPPALLPEHWRFENYASVWRTGPFDRYFLNSLLVSVGIVLMELLVSVPAAYTFANKSFRGSGIIYALILFGMMIPMQVVVLPVYLLLSRAGWINTFAALIIPFISSSSSIFILTETFKQIPGDYIDAAKIDRATDRRIIWSVILPIARPILITIALLVFIAHWNDLFWVLVMTNNDKLQTLTAGIVKLKDAEGLQWNMLMAGNMLLIAPVLLLYAAASKKIKSGFAFTGMK